jgi:hypothetical protein
VSLFSSRGRVVLRWAFARPSEAYVGYPTLSRELIAKSRNELSMFAFLARSTSDRAGAPMAKHISFAPSAPVSRNKRVVTISLQHGNREETMTITVSVPNDGDEQDVYALSLARARDFARHFLEFPFECPQRKAHPKQ